MSRVFNRRRGQKGFTLIELLIVVAIIGIIAAILIPNLLDALQKAKQKRTMGDMRNVGTAWFSWFQDQVSAAAAGSSVTVYTLAADDLERTALLSLLQPTTDMIYIQKIPEYDGWGGAYDFTDGDLTDLQVMAIGSGGRDGGTNFDMSSQYTMGPFVATDYNHDIIWADGFFVAYPAGSSVVGNQTTP